MSAETYLIANHHKHNCSHNGKGLTGGQVKSKERSSYSCQSSCLHPVTYGSILQMAKCVLAVS